MCSCGEIGGGEIGEAYDVGFDEGTIADNIDYLRDSFESVGPNGWNRLSLSERMDALRLLETRTAELEGRDPRAVVCENMDGESFSETDTVHVNAKHLGTADFQESVLKQFSFRGHPISFRGDFEDLMRQKDELLSDCKEFVKKNGLSIEERIERGTRRLSEMREALRRSVEHKLTQPMEVLQQDLRDAKLALAKEVAHQREMGVLQDQNDRKTASLRGQTMDQFYAEERGYEQVYPKNFYGFHDGNPNLFAKDDKLYELLPSGNLHEVYSTGDLASIPSANVRK